MRVFLINVVREHINVNMQGRHIEIQAIQSNQTSGSLTLFKIRFRLDGMFDVMLSRIMSFDNGVLTMLVPLFDDDGDDDGQQENEDEHGEEEEEENNDKGDDQNDGDDDGDDDDDDDETLSRRQSATNAIALSQ